MIIAFARKGLICAATAGLLVLTILPGLAQTKKLGDGLTFEGAGASFIGSGQTTTLNCSGGGAHILGNNNTLTLTGACKWLDMVGSNNTVVAALPTVPTLSSPVRITPSRGRRLMAKNRWFGTWVLAIL